MSMLLIGSSLRTLSSLHPRLIKVSGTCSHPRDLVTATRQWMCARSCKTSSDAFPLVKQWDSSYKDDIHVADEAVSAAGSEFTGKLFSEFPLHPALLKQLQVLGMERTFEVQDKTLPLTLDGKDVIGRAITGSGKTLAFALPIVHILSQSRQGYQPRAIVITPTRELCNQVAKSVQQLSSTIHCASIYGGDSFARQERELRRGVDVVCGTPGRLNDHLERGNLSLEDVQFLVLDEADELLTPNFLDQIKDILNDCPPTKQMMLFSATMPYDAKMVAKRFMRDPVMVDLVNERSLVPSSVQHEAVQVPGNQRRSVVGDLLLISKPTKAIVFTSSRIETMTMAKHLRAIGFNAEPLNSDLTQSAREDCLNKFRNGKVTVLVATDVAARGIDVPETDMVIQVDPPPSGIDFYIHRSGRTGRKGQAGRSVIVLANDNDRRSNPYMMKGSGSFLRDMSRAGIKVNMISPPSEDEVVAAMMEHNWSRLSKVDKETVQATKPHVVKLLGEMEGVEALSAAMAVLSDLSVRRWQVQRREREDKGYNRREHGDRGFDRYPRGGQQRGYYPKRGQDRSWGDSYNKRRSSSSYRDDRNPREPIW